MGKFVNVSKIAGCVVSVSLSTAMLMSTAVLPIQAKTYNTETISMTQSAKVAKKSTKKSKSSQVSWKNAGKPLQCTVKTERDFYKAMSNAIRLNAPTLKVTFDKSYKGTELVNNRNNVDKTLLDIYKCMYVYDLGMSEFGVSGWKVVEHNADYSVATIRLSYDYYGTAFPHAYNTGDTSSIDKKYATMYEIFSEAADNCSETTDLGKAEYAWNWVIDNMVYDDVYALSHSFVDSFNNPTASGKYKGCCEDYAEAYILLMRMLNVPCWLVPNDVIEDILGHCDYSTQRAKHAIVCAQINGEYRYFDPTFGKTEGVGTRVFNMTAKEASKWYSPWVCTYEIDMSANKDTRMVTYSELEKYFIW